MDIEIVKFAKIETHWIALYHYVLNDLLLFSLKIPWYVHLERRVEIIKNKKKRIFDFVVCHLIFPLSFKVLSLFSTNCNCIVLFLYLFFSIQFFVSLVFRIAHLTSSNFVGLPKIYNIHNQNDGYKCSVTTLHSHKHTHTKTRTYAQTPSHQYVVHPCISINVQWKINKNQPLNQIIKMYFVSFTVEKKIHIQNLIW